MRSLSFILMSASVTACVYADVVEDIEYQGLDRVEAAAIEEALVIQRNKSFDFSDIDQSIKNLYNKDFFSDVSIAKKGSKLLVTVKEKPIVDKVAFEGNDAISDDMLKNVLNGRLGEGRLYSSYVVKDILSDLQLAYQAWGYYFTQIKPKFIDRGNNQIDIVFQIKEGYKTVIDKIILVGNKTFSDDQIKDIMDMKEAKAWRFFDNECQIFREDKVDSDVDNITKFYRSKGFPFFEVTSTHTEMSTDRKSHFCTFIMNEGDLYHIRNISLQSDIPEVNAANYQQFIGFKSKDIYNESLIYAVRDKIRKEIALQGNAFIDVLVNIDYDEVNNLADISYKIVNSDKVFVDRIEIIGNTRTLDKVIRRELTVHEGDALNPYKIQRSIDKLKGMEYFDDVQVSEEEGSAEDKKVVIIKVKEKESTAQLRFGLNANDSDGFGGFIGYVENNLFGTGRVLSAEIMWMQQYRGGNIDIFDPRFFDQNVGAGIKLGLTEINRKKFESASVRSMFIAPYIKYSITENLIHKLGYSVSFNKRMFWDRTNNKWTDSLPKVYKDDRYEYRRTNVDIKQKEYGKYTTCELSSVLTYFKLDNPYDPRDGFDISLTNAYAGIFGNVKYFKNILAGNIYKPVTEKITFILNGQLGHIKEISNTRSGDRFTLGGGYTMRGFDSYGIGAKEIEAGDIITEIDTGKAYHDDSRANSLGSTKYWTVSFMLKAPLSTKEVGINGVAFLDFGSAWGSNFPSDRIYDSSAIRASTGIAIEWVKCPLGMPLSFVFGFALKKKKFDEKQVFTLTGMM